MKLIDKRDNESMIEAGDLIKKRGVGVEYLLGTRRDVTLGKSEYVLFCAQSGYVTDLDMPIEVIRQKYDLISKSEDLELIYR